MENPVSKTYNSNLEKFLSTDSVFGFIAALDIDTNSDWTGCNTLDELLSLSRTDVEGLVSNQYHRIQDDWEYEIHPIVLTKDDTSNPDKVIFTPTQTSFSWKFTTPAAPKYNAFNRFMQRIFRRHSEHGFTGVMGNAIAIFDNAENILFVTFMYGQHSASGVYGSTYEYRVALGDLTLECDKPAKPKPVAKPRRPRKKP
jgi:hypothetical protein